MCSFLWNQLISSHVMNSQDSIIYTSWDNYICINSITEHVDLPHSTFMSLRYFDRFRPIDVPESNWPIFTSTHDQWVVPLKSQASIFVTFEQTIHTLQGIKIPNEQTGIICRTHSNVVLIDHHFWDWSIMTSQVRASLGTLVPQAEHLIHASR